MKFTEAIILAGGLGTRLRSAVADLPKCMAPVNGKPFISYVIQHLQYQNITNYIFALGYKSEDFLHYISSVLNKDSYRLSIEQEPLGTGGAIKLACASTKNENVLVLNGDTLFEVDVNALAEFHVKNKSDCTIALKPMRMFERYGVVKLSDDNSVKSFTEKQFYTEGLINGGVYALNVPDFLKEKLPEKFSFEKDYLENFFNKRPIYGLVQDKYFIDIGIPEDYSRAQRELKP